ncbi:HNH endonuclease signature motif containing protein, partial [Actinomadura adrarensis]
ERSDAMTEDMTVTRRLALTAGVSPLILGTGGIPLYLGRRVRFATPGQRRVLESIYANCAVVGCEVPGTMCEVDHVAGWSLGNAPTDIDQLTLACSWHNRWRHTNPHQIHIDQHNGRWVYRLLPPDTPTTAIQPGKHGKSGTGAGRSPRHGHYEHQPPRDEVAPPHLPRQAA